MYDAPHAQAYTHHCGKSFNISGNPISYRYYSITGAYQSAFGGAQGRWDAASVPGYFNKQMSNGDPTVEVRDGKYSDDFWGRTEWTCGAGVRYWGNETYVKFNQNTVSGLSAREKKIVAVHEIGHAYGLGHVYTGCANHGPAVMRQGQGKFACGSEGPWYDDTSGVRAKY